MSIKLFNYTNQKLNADKLREIEVFNSGNFAGVVGKNFPISFSGTSATISASESSPITFLGGGLLIQLDHTVTFTLGMNDTLGYLEVNLDSSAANITTDELLKYKGEDTENNPPTSIFENLITFKSCVCDSETFKIKASYTYFSPVLKAEGNPHDNQYYEYVYDAETHEYKYILSSDTDITEDNNKTYYYKIDSNAISFKSSALGTQTIFTYFGNTIWLSDTTFIIPICANIDGTLWSSVVCLKDFDDFEKLLTLESYARLKNYCDGTFVWSSGGVDIVTAPDGTTHRKGDVGNLNITGDTICNNIDVNYPVKINKLAVNNLATTGEPNNSKLSVNSNGEVVVVKNYIQPIAFGGTGASDKMSAKRELGIYFGSDDPKLVSPVTKPAYGDIYLRIIE